MNDRNGLMLFETQTSNIVAGITTNDFGNMKYYGDATQNQIKLAKKQIAKIATTFNADTSIKINPEHGEAIFKIALENKEKINDFESYFDDIMYDGLIFHPDSKNQKVMLAVPTGDCPAIILSDGVSIAIIHSGWRGSEKNIVRKAVAIMNSHGTYNAEATEAIIWPGICSKCYKVGEEISSKFPEHTAGNHLSLRSVIAKQLLDVGIKKSHMKTIAYCSFCDEHYFFSHRRGNKERNLVFVISGQGRKQ